MRLSQIYLDGFGIDYKKIRPTTVLDVIDGLLASTSIACSITSTKELFNLDFRGNSKSLESISKDPVLMKLIDKPQATSLYMQLYPALYSDTSIFESTYKDIHSCMGIEYKRMSNFHRALALAISNINDALTDMVILHSQYSGKSTFVILRGSNLEELSQSLYNSSAQSPITIDKLQAICLTRLN